MKLDQTFFPTPENCVKNKKTLEKEPFQCSVYSSLEVYLTVHHS